MGTKEKEVEPGWFARQATEAKKEMDKLPDWMQHNSEESVSFFGKARESRTAQYSMGEDDDE